MHPLGLIGFMLEERNRIPWINFENKVAITVTSHFFGVIPKDLEGYTISNNCVFTYSLRKVTGNKVLEALRFRDHRVVVH
jgi:hypothetical protein